MNDSANANDTAPEQPAVSQEPHQVPGAPAPQPTTPGQQQAATAQAYFAQPQAAPVQYVVMAESLKGVKGWLLFLTIMFGFAGLGYTGTFFSSMTDLSSATSVVGLIFAPILAILAIATVVFVAMEKKLGKWLAVGTLGVSALYSVINVVATAVAGTSGEETPLVVGSIMTILIAQGLLALYFFVSKRVKETLIK